MELSITVGDIVYADYRSFTEPQSKPEKEFEKYLEKAKNVLWYCKNGDKGKEYFSIVYGNSMKKQHLFHPDYVVSVGNETWIIGTKGGFSCTGGSHDIDAFSVIKYKYLYQYITQNNLKDSFVRKDEKTVNCVSVPKNIATTLTALIGSCF